MQNTEFLYLNNFSVLHNNQNIFFCKTDYITKDFDVISKLNNNIIFITGNSDYPITDEIVNLAPKNIKKWYAQNAVSNSTILHPIPIGLENKILSSRAGHGVDYFDRASEKEQLLNFYASNQNSTKLIYANFNINTNYTYRSIIKQYCEYSSFIDWEDPIPSLSDFFAHMSQYKMVVCPAGNGIDTHRLWEVLYLNKIPITIKTGNYKIYDLYEQLPIILLNNINELLDYNTIMKKYTQCKNKNWNRSLLNTEYWLQEILNNA